MRVKIAVLLVVFAGCRGKSQEGSQGLATTASSQGLVQSAVAPLAGALHVLPPLVAATGDVANLDRTLTPWLSVGVCQVTAQGGCTPVQTFTSTNCTKTPQCIALQSDHYQVNWQADRALTPADFQVHFAVAGLEISFITVHADNGRTFPISYRIDRHPRIRARVLHAQGQNAIQIATAIQNEFAIGGAAVTQILFAEKFSSVEIGGALVAVFGVTAQEAAQWMHDAGISAADTAHALVVVFNQTAAEVAAMMQGIFQLGGSDTTAILVHEAFLPDDIGTALVSVYGATASDAARWMYLAGAAACDTTKMLAEVFGENISTLVTELPAAGYSLNAANTCLQQRAAIDSAPLIVLHPQESFFPSSVEFALAHQQVTCYGDNDSATSFSANALLQPNPPLPAPDKQGQCYLTTNKPPTGPYDCNTPDGYGCSDPDLNYLFGDAVGTQAGQVPVYVSIYSLGPGVFNVEYKTFYPYNYGKKACTGLWGTDSCIQKTVQDDNHVGDWEGMSVQYVNWRPVAVRVAAHSTDSIGTTFTNLSQLQWTGTHPIVYAAKGSHGIWPDGNGDHTYLTLPTGQPLIDNTGNGQQWQTWKNTVLISQEGVENGWFHAYKGRWGNSPKYIPNNESMCQQALNGFVQCVGLCTDDLLEEFPLNPGPTTPPGARDKGTLPARYASLAAYLAPGTSAAANQCDTALKGSAYGGPVIRLADPLLPIQNNVYVNSPGAPTLPGCELENRAATFQIVPGLAPGGVSIESVTRPGSFLYLPTPADATASVAVQVGANDGSKSFAASATFNAVPSLANPTDPLGFSLQVVTPPPGFADTFLRLSPGNQLALSPQPQSGDNRANASFSVVAPLTTYRDGMHWGALDEQPITIPGYRPGSQNGGTFIFWVRNHTTTEHHITIYQTLIDSCYATGSHLAAAELSPGMEYGFTSSLFTYGSWIRVDDDDPGYNVAEMCSLAPKDLNVIAGLLAAAYVLAIDIVAPYLGPIAMVGAIGAAGYGAYWGISDPGQASDDINNIINEVNDCAGAAGDTLVQTFITNGADSAQLLGKNFVSGLQQALLSLPGVPKDDQRTVSLWRRLDGGFCFGHQEDPCF